MSSWKVTLVSPDGEEMLVHPENLATHGVYLTEAGVKGDIIDAPVKTEWDSLAKQEGGTQRGVDWEYRDISLQFHVTDNSRLSAEEADSMLRMMFDYEEDEWDTENPQRQAKLILEVIGGPFAGSERSLDILMYEAPEMELNRDPFKDQYFNPTLNFRAGQPMYYEPMDVQPFEFEGSGTFEGEVMCYNPTDRAVRHTWIVAAGAGARAWLPDFSWIGPRGKRKIGGPHPTRMIQVPEITPEGGGIRVTLKRGKVMVEDLNGTNAMGRMPVQGQFFMYRIPPYTPKTMLPVKIMNVPPSNPGGRIELRMDRYWSRPYGLEMF